MVKSAKPNKSSSLQNAIGGLCIIIFGGFWLHRAIRMGAPKIMLTFGTVFLVVGILIAALGFYNASAKKRLSKYDMVEEETDTVQKKLDEQ